MSSATQYLIEQELSVGMWFKKFSITADTEPDALSKARRWARYHGSSVRSVRVRPTTDQDARYGLRDEWIPSCS